MLPQFLGMLLLIGTAGFVVVAIGASWDYDLLFPAAARSAGSVLVVTWDGGLDYLVPGAGNPLVQRQRRLALPSPAGA